MFFVVYRLGVASTNVHVELDFGASRAVGLGFRGLGFRV